MNQTANPTLLSLVKKLNPRRFPGMSAHRAAIVAYIVGIDRANWTANPSITEMAVTSDGFVLEAHDGEVGLNHFVGPASDLRRNWENLLNCAKLTKEERDLANILFAQHVPHH